MPITKSNKLQVLGLREDPILPAQFSSKGFIWCSSKQPTEGSPPNPFGVVVLYNLGNGRSSRCDPLDKVIPETPAHTLSLCLTTVRLRGQNVKRQIFKHIWNQYEDFTRKFLWSLKCFILHSDEKHSTENDFRLSWTWRIGFTWTSSTLQTPLIVWRSYTQVKKKATGRPMKKATLHILRSSYFKPVPVLQFLGIVDAG